jgi:hypothetical protein
MLWSNTKLCMCDRVLTSVESSVEVSREIQRAGSDNCGNYQLRVIGNSETFAATTRYTKPRKVAAAFSIRRDAHGMSAGASTWCNAWKLPNLPASSAAMLVARLCRHSDVALFSAAQPGQGGEGHVNGCTPKLRQGSATRCQSCA